MVDINKEVKLKEWVNDLFSFPDAPEYRSGVAERLYDLWLETKDPRAAKAITAALADENPDIRKEAIYYLKKIDPKAIQPVIARIEEAIREIRKK